MSCLHAPRPLRQSAARRVRDNLPADHSWDTLSSFHRSGDHRPRFDASGPGIPGGKELDPERLDFVHVPMRVEDEAVVARLSQQDPTPIVDELRDVDGPVHLGDLTEYGREEVVEHDLPIEADDQVMDLARESRSHFA